MEEQEQGPLPEITIRRDWTRDEWVYLEMGAHKVGTHYAARTPADIVIRQLKTKANGRLKVIVRLD